MPRQLERTIRVDCPNEMAFDLARQSLINVGLNIKEANEDSGEIKASKGLSLRTYGHNVVVQIDGTSPSAPAQTALTISSKVRFPQLVDYGTNQQIVNQFENQFKTLLSMASRDGRVERSAHGSNV